MILGITGGSGSGAVGAGGANGTPIIQANVAKGAYKAHLFSAALRVNFVDMQRSNLIGRSLDQLLQDGIRLTYDKHMDANVYTGFDFLAQLNLPSTFYNMLPYIISLLVLALTSSKSRAPKAEGIPYDKGSR